MRLEAIDHVVLAARSVESSTGPFVRLGLKLSNVVEHTTGNEHRTFAVGAGENLFYVAVLAPWADPAPGSPDTQGELRSTISAGGGLHLVAFRTQELDQAVEELRERGIDVWSGELVRLDGRKVADIARFGDRERMGLRAALIEHEQSVATLVKERQSAGLFNHDFPLKRLDHLAAIVQNLDVATRYWDETAGVTVYGEVKTPAMIIRQLMIGDAILELLGPSGPESPVAARPPGLASMVAFEVDGLDDAVTLARDRGFTVTDPSDGVLPGTRTATIPADQLSGMSMQLLEYV
jgi:catechol 2,3-dioxygenase-like lactoylglutathione lyase family enzyme